MAARSRSAAPSVAGHRRVRHGDNRAAHGERAMVSLPGVRVAQLQRARLLAAAVTAFDELGYGAATVADVTRRARVSRRTFYEQFANCDECLAGVLDDAVASVERELAATVSAGRPWQERVRAGLWTILAFLDRDPALARVCVLQAARGGALLVERRGRALRRLVTIVDEGRVERARGVNPSPLTGEGVVGAVLAIVQARIAVRDTRPLTSLLGELMEMIVLPYRGAAAARRELSRPAPSMRDSARYEERVADPSAPVGEDLLQGVRMRLTYRTARVLEGVGAHPGASNRQVADHAGIGDPGQVSKLLRRLEGLGLLENRGGGRVQGEPNEWRLTGKGALVADGIRLYTPQPRKAT